MESLPDEHRRHGILLDRDLLGGPLEDRYLR
jgi:hypothetical protein